MKETLVLAAVCFLSISGVTWGSIVYSGSQNVTLTLSPMSPMNSRTIEIGGMSGNWDDFQVDLGLEMGMPGKGGIYLFQVPPTPCGWHFCGLAHA